MSSSNLLRPYKMPFCIHIHCCVHEFIVSPQSKSIRAPQRLYSLTLLFPLSLVFSVSLKKQWTKCDYFVKQKHSSRSRKLWQLNSAMQYYVSTISYHFSRASVLIWPNRRTNTHKQMQTYTHTHTWLQSQRVDEVCFVTAVIPPKQLHYMQKSTHSLNYQPHAKKLPLILYLSQHGALIFTLSAPTPLNFPHSKHLKHTFCVSIAQRLLADAILSHILVNSNLIKLAFSKSHRI